MRTHPYIVYIDRFNSSDNLFSRKCTTELSDNSEFSIVYTVYYIQYTNICSSSHNHTQSSLRTPCQIPMDAKKLRPDRPWRLNRLDG